MKKQILSSALVLALLMGSLMGCAEEKKPAHQDAALKGSQSEPATSGPSESTKPTEKVNEKPKPSTGTPKPDESKPSQQPEPSEPAASQPPKASEPAATEPTPTKPEPTEPIPTEPAPTEPSPTEPEPPAHVHSYSSTTVAPTCTAEGYTKHTCSCGESYNDSQTAALGHSYTDTVVEATTTSGGYTTHTCSRCGDSFTDSYTPVIEVPRWDTEEAVADICARANAYAESQGAIVDPEMAQSWAAPDSTSWGEPSAEWYYERCVDEINLVLSLVWKYIYITYAPDSDGGFYIYNMHG